MQKNQSFGLILFEFLFGPGLCNLVMNYKFKTDYHNQ